MLNTINTVVSIILSTGAALAGIQGLLTWYQPILEPQLLAQVIEEPYTMLNTMDTVVSIILGTGAVLAGIQGLLTWYRPILEPQLSAQVIEVRGNTYVIAVGKIKNIGRTRVRLSPLPTITLYRHPEKSEKECLHTLDAFQNALKSRKEESREGVFEAWIEAGETLEHQCLTYIELPKSAVAYALRLYCSGHAQTLKFNRSRSPHVWTAETVIASQNVQPGMKLSTTVAP